MLQNRGIILLLVLFHFLVVCHLNHVQNNEKNAVQESRGKELERHRKALGSKQTDDDDDDDEDEVPTVVPTYYGKCQN